MVLLKEVIIITIAFKFNNFDQVWHAICNEQIYISYLLILKKKN